MKNIIAIKLLILMGQITPKLILMKSWVTIILIV